jgi:hypothetical protein
MSDLQQYVPQVHFEQIPIKNLVSNQEYQRSLSLSHVKRAAENFDLYQINPVKVSRRNGINYVFNGQHTIEIVALVSGSRDTPVWCMVYDDLEYTQEADIFANQLKYTKALTPFEIFNANIEAGNDKQLVIRSLIESYGLSIVPSKALGGICAISTIESIFDRYGFHVLDRVLRLVVGTWEGDPNSFAANMLSGVCRLIVTYGDNLKDDIFKEKLGTYSVREISRTAKERQAGSLGYAEAILLLYNRKMKAGALRWNALYSAKGRKPLNAGFEDEEPVDQESVDKEDEPEDSEADATGASDTEFFGQEVLDEMESDSDEKDEPDDTEESDSDVIQRSFH